MGESSIRLAAAFDPGAAWIYCDWLDEYGPPGAGSLLRAELNEGLRGFSDGDGDGYLYGDGYGYGYGNGDGYGYGYGYENGYGYG